MLQWEQKDIKRKFRGRGETRDLSKENFEAEARLETSQKVFFRRQGIFQGLKIKISRSRRDRGEEFYVIPRSF